MRPGPPVIDTWLLAQRYRSSGPSRVVPGRFEYSFIEFVLLVMVLLGGTFIALKLAREYGQRRDERRSETSGGWRLRSQLDVEAGSPYNRFSGLALRMPHDVMEGHDEGFEVSYFSAHLPRRAGDNAEARPVLGETGSRRDVPHAIVQLPVDPPLHQIVSTDAGRPTDGWGPRATQVLGADAVLERRVGR